MKLRSILLVCSILLSPALSASDLLVRHAKPVGDPHIKSHYAYHLLKLALDKTVQSHGPYTLQSSDMVIPQDRAVLALAQGNELDVVWAMTSAKREETLLPIHIPLRKGLLGYRVLIIKKKDENKFSHINSIKDLQAFKAGQGHDWPDVKILRANQLFVFSSPTFDSLFKMLNAGRFDYFPRAVYEAQAEIENNLSYDLMIEKRLLLKYFSPLFFFTNRNNPKLASRIEIGLLRAIDDGDFNKLLYNTSEMKTLFETWRLEDRKIIHLKNPHLTPKTTSIIGKQHLWYTPGEEQHIY